MSIQHHLAPCLFLIRKIRVMIILFYFYYCAFSFRRSIAYTLLFLILSLFHNAAGWNNSHVLEIRKFQAENIYALILPTSVLGHAPNWIRLWCPPENDLCTYLASPDPWGALCGTLGPVGQYFTGYIAWTFTSMHFKCESLEQGNEAFYVLLILWLLKLTPTMFGNMFYLERNDRFVSKLVYVLSDDQIIHV